MDQRLQLFNGHALHCSAGLHGIEVRHPDLRPEPHSAGHNESQRDGEPAVAGEDINGNSSICGTTKNKAGCLVQVSVSYQFSYMVPFLPAAAQTMSATAQAVITE